MSEANEMRLDGKTVITLESGQKFAVDLLEEQRAMRGLAKKLTEESKTQDDYLDAVVAHVQQKHGVTLSIGEADSFVDGIDVAVLKKKEQRRKAASSLVESLRSTPA